MRPIGQAEKFEVKDLAAGRQQMISAASLSSIFTYLKEPEG